MRYLDKMKEVNYDGVLNLENIVIKKKVIILKF